MFKFKFKFKFKFIKHVFDCFHADVDKHIELSDLSLRDPHK